VKKKVNIILIILVCGIWATIAYRYFYVKEIKTNDFSFSDNNLPIRQIGKDTFDLKPVDRDPFLGNYRSIKKNKELSLSPQKKTKVILPFNNHTKPIVYWPNIEYMGFIKAQGNEKELVILKINDKIHRVRKAEKVQDIYIKEIFKDSVIIRLHKEEQTFSKERKW
jgi:hypothetical protein